MKIRFAGLFLLASLFLLSACGQKGPLYLKKEPVSAPAAATGTTGFEKETVDYKTEKDAADSKTENIDSDIKSDTKD